MRASERNRPRPGGLARGTGIVGGAVCCCNDLGRPAARTVSREDHGASESRVMTDPRTAIDSDTASAQPETAADVDPDVARLLGLRPADADPVPDAAEIDTLGEMTNTRIYEGDLAARPPDSDQPD